MKNLILITSILLFGCNSNPNEWSDEKQNQFRSNCQQLKDATIEYCDCVLNNLMLEYNEQTYKIESTEILKNNTSKKFATSIDAISEACR